MAYRYNRINWQNKPNVATPISAENLNKMDKGIKDCDDAIGDLALLNTNNKTDLVSAINEQNNNFVNLIEEGTFVPILVGSTVAGVNTYVIQQGKYYKIGKKVHVDIRVKLSAKDEAMSGQVYIQGLPFPPQATYQHSGSISLSDGISYPPNTIYLAPNITSITGIRLMAMLSTGTFTIINATNITNTTDLILSIDYLTA